jgi:hypothetical protein
VKIVMQLFAAYMQRNNSAPDWVAILAVEGQKG